MAMSAPAWGAQSRAWIVADGVLGRSCACSRSPRTPGPASGRPRSSSSGAVLIATAMIMPERGRRHKGRRSPRVMPWQDHAVPLAGSRPARRRARSRRGRRVLTLGSAGRCSRTPGFRAGAACRGSSWPWQGVVPHCHVRQRAHCAPGRPAPTSGPAGNLLARQRCVLPRGLRHGRLKRSICRAAPAAGLVYGA